MSGVNEEDDGVLMETIRKQGYRWFWTWFSQRTPNVYKVDVVLGGYGEFCCEIETMRMLEVESNLSLSFLSTVKIGKILKPSACCDFLSVNIETALVAPLNGRV